MKLNRAFIGYFDPKKHISCIRKVSIVWGGLRSRSTELFSLVQTVRALESCRVLSLKRSEYLALERAFPVATRLIMSNLKLQALRVLDATREAIEVAVKDHEKGSMTTYTSLKQLVVRFIRSDHVSANVTIASPRK